MKMKIDYNIVIIKFLLENKKYENFNRINNKYIILLL